MSLDDNTVEANMTRKNVISQTIAQDAKNHMQERRNNRLNPKVGLCFPAQLTIVAPDSQSCPRRREQLQLKGHNTARV